MANKIKEVFRKVLNFPAVRIILGIVMLNVGLFLLRNLTELLLSGLSINNDIILSTGIFVIRILGLIFLYSLYVRMYERRKPSEIMFTRDTAKHVFLGAIIGLLLIAAVVGINCLFGWITLEKVNESPRILEGIYFTVFFVLLQDFIYFLILFRITEKYLGTYWTILLSGLIFGFKHLLFPDYSIVSGIIIFVDVTFIFSALFLKSRSLWGIFGFHFVYNFVQNIILGNPVMEGIQSVFDLNVDGPVIFTGDPSGFETSIIAVIACVAFGTFYLNNLRKQGLFLDPCWRKHLRNTKTPDPNNIRQPND